MKKFKKLIPALALLLVSAVLMSTASYAWFSMNNKVTVTGMEVTTKVSSNLLIAPANDEAQFTTKLAQTRTGILEPVSTKTGKAFFYTTDALANGKKATAITGSGAVPYVSYSEGESLTNSTAGKTAYDEDFIVAYGVSSSSVTTSTVRYGYIDYTFYLKATSTEADQIVRLSGCNLLYDGAAITEEKAWRVGVFAQEVAAGVAGSGEGDLVSILALSGAAYHDNTAVSAVDAKAAADQLATAATIATDLDAGVTKYFKVVVRLWLEGEDTTCTNETFANLAEGYTLDLEFAIGDTTGITAITSTVPTP